MGRVKYHFTAVGLAMLLGALAWCLVVRSFVAGASRAEGTVVGLSRSNSSTGTGTTYRPVVRFTDPSGAPVEFTARFGTSPPRYHTGDSVRVLYRPANPSDARIDDFFSLWFGPSILGGIGVMFFAMGGGWIVLARRQAREDEYLRQEGRRIETAFQSVALNTTLNVNGRNPYRVLTQWQDPATSEIRVFHSHNVWSDPTAYIKPKQAITVFVAPNNPQEYYVDLSFLPRQVTG